MEEPSDQKNFKMKAVTQDISTLQLQQKLNKNPQQQQCQS